MLKRLLVVCGPTATGKTKLALKLAKKFRGELISADSRQVYKGFDIGSGKDIPPGSIYKIVSFENQKKSNSTKSKNGYYQIGRVKIWGYDLADPRGDFSAAEYSQTAREIVNNIWERGNLPIIVGGTGFYIMALTDGFETTLIPPDNYLRRSLAFKSTTELYDTLFKLNNKKALTMNNSDRKNPRRLIRAIEVSKWILKGKKSKSGDLKINYDSLLTIALKTSKEVLDKRVIKRVEERLNNGFEKEVAELLKNGINWKCQAMQGMGYRQYEDFYKKNISKDRFIQKWILAEQKYVKRQLTWFKKDKKAVWFDIAKPDFYAEVEKKVQSWYDYN